VSRLGEKIYDSRAAFVCRDVLSGPRPLYVARKKTRRDL
jgi:hypothetical protein